MPNVIGWYGHKNVGDESYKISFPKVFPASKFQFHPSQSNDDSIAILGGGDILDEKFVSKLLDQPAKKRYAISVSANSNSPVHLLDKVDGIWVRDYESVKFLNKHGITATYMPDVSTCLTGSPVNGNRLIERYYENEKLELYGKKVGIVFSSYLCSGKSDMLARDHITFNKVVSDLGSIIDSTSASFIFFPMSTGMPHDDRVTNGFLANQCKFWKKNYVVYDRLNVCDTVDLIAACDVIISTRLHASIFALNNNVPFIDITHHDKNLKFLKTINHKYTASYWNMDRNLMKNMLQNLIGDATVYKEELCKTHAYHLKILESESANVYFGQ